MQRAIHGKDVLSIAGSRSPALAPNAYVLLSRASVFAIRLRASVLPALKPHPCEGGGLDRGDDLRLRRTFWGENRSRPLQADCSTNAGQVVERRAKYLPPPPLRSRACSSRSKPSTPQSGLLRCSRNDDALSRRDVPGHDDFSLPRPCSPGLTRSQYFRPPACFTHGLRIKSGARRWDALVHCYQRLADAVSPHRDGHSRGKFGAVSFAATAAAAICGTSLPAKAQTLSGGISVQMQVGSRATENSPRNGGGAQTLGATTTDCTASSVPINFGRVTLNAAGTLPVNPGGTLRPIDADGSVSVICIPAGNPNGPGTSSVGIQISGTHGSPPLLLMTLNDTNISQGITYNLYKSPLRTSGTAFLFNDSVTATVEGNSQADRTTVDLYGRVGIPTYPGGKPPAGMYRDTLTVTLFF